MVNKGFAQKELMRNARDAVPKIKERQLEKQEKMPKLATPKKTSTGLQNAMATAQKLNDIFELAAKLYGKGEQRKAIDLINTFV